MNIGSILTMSGEQILRTMSKMIIDSVSTVPVGRTYGLACRDDEHDKPTIPKSRFGQVEPMLRHFSFHDAGGFKFLSVSGHLLSLGKSCSHLLAQAASWCFRISPACHCRYEAAKLYCITMGLRCLTPHFSMEYE